MVALGCKTNLVAQIANLPGTLNKPLRTTGLYEVTEGSPFFRDIFLKGRIIDKDGDTREVYLKYDTYIDEVLISGESNVMIIDRSYYPQFEIEELDDETGEVSRFIFTNQISFEDHEKFKYARVLFTSSSAQILKTIKTILIKSEEEGYGGNKIPSYFKQKINYYLQDKRTGSVYSIALKNNQIVKALTKYQGIKAYLKTNKIRIREESELRTLIEFMDSYYK